VDLTEILSDVLRERGFSACDRSEDDFPMDHMVVGITDDHGLTRTVVVGPSSQSQTSRFVKVSLNYPQLDDGENTCIGYHNTVIEFAAPDSIEQFISMVEKKFV
jgi:hypothetical protein